MNINELKAHYSEELKDDELFDYENCTFRATVDGEYLMRIIPNGDEDLFFHADGYHILDGDFYQDCLDTTQCPICKKIRLFEESGNPVLVEIAEKMKRNSRYTYQIVLVNREGDIIDPIPKLLSVPPTLHTNVVKQIINIGEDAIDLKKGRIFTLIRETGEKYVNYKKSHFSSQPSALDISQVEMLNKLTDGKNYSYTRAKKHLEDLDEMERIHMENNLVNESDRIPLF